MHPAKATATEGGVNPGAALSRHWNWKHRLAVTLWAWSDAPFTWGKYDCVHFARAVLISVVGKDFGDAIETYATEREALEVLAKGNGESLRQAVEIAIGVEAVKDRLPMDGDLVMASRPVVGFPGRRGDGLGVCEGERLVFVGGSGLERVPRLYAAYSWPI